MAPRMQHTDRDSALGESLGAWTMGDDAAMLRTVAGANLACGFNAGEPAGIMTALKAARTTVRSTEVSP